MFPLTEGNINTRLVHSFVPQNIIYTS